MRRLRVILLLTFNSNMQRLTSLKAMFEVFISNNKNENDQIIDFAGSRW